MNDKDFKRFAARLSAAPDGCLLWMGCRTRVGYGLMGLGGKLQSTHRIAFEHWKGAIPAGMVVMHTCDVRLCCNPDHLKLGTMAENNADRDRKGRHASTIVQTDATEIRQRALAGEDRGEIARRFGISRDMVNKIARGERWAKVKAA